MSDQIITIGGVGHGGTRAVNQYINTADDTVRFRTARAAAAHRPDGTVIRMTDDGAPDRRTLRRCATLDGVTVTDVRPVGDRPVVADVALSRALFGHRTARASDWINSRPNADERRIASGGRTTDAARAQFSAMLADTAARLNVDADALTAWLAAHGDTANVPTDDALAAMRQQ